MPALFPNAAAAESFKVGQQVKWFINEGAVSPYIGRVSEVCPGINKVWVEWPIGGNTQMDPTDLIIVTAESDGISQIDKETGYGSFDKEKSKKNFGDLQPRSLVRLANKIASEISGEMESDFRRSVQAEDIAQKFASDVIEKVSSDILDCKKSGMSDVQAYCEVYPKYENICSDHLMRFAIGKIYGQQ